VEATYSIISAVVQLLSNSVSRWTSRWTDWRVSQRDG